MSDDERTSARQTGMTWADALSRFPMWALAGAVVVFVGFLIYAAEFAEDRFELGVLGTFGPLPPSGAAATALPDGAVVAFATECPEDQGWVRYEDAAARFVIGAATEAELDQGPAASRNGSNGEKLTERPLGEANGTEMVRLEIEEMPAHQHEMRLYMQGSAGNDRLEPRPWSAEVPNDPGQRVYQDGVASAGGGPDGRANPHYNMPPYVALYFCRKGNG